MEKWTRRKIWARKGTAVTLAVMLVLTTTGITAAAQEVDEVQAFDALNDALVSPASDEEAEGEAPAADSDAPDEPETDEPEAPDSEEESDSEDTDPKGGSPEGDEPGDGAEPEGDSSADSVDPGIRAKALAAPAALDDNPTADGTAPASEADVRATSEARSTDIASGTAGECEWRIDADGKLTITPGAGGGNKFTYADYSPNPPWDGHREKIITVEIPEAVIAYGKLPRMFHWCTNLTSINGLTNLDTSNVTDMEMMFFHCESLTSLDLSAFDTSKVASMLGMFGYCENLGFLDISSFNASSATTMNSIFTHCTRLKSIKMPESFNTGNVTDMSGMFEYCHKLESVDLSGLDTPAVTLMTAMFALCSSLTSLDFSKFNTAKVRDKNEMFWGCDSLKTVQVGEDFSFSALNFGGFFHGAWWLSGETGVAYGQNELASRNKKIDTYEKVYAVSEVEISNVEVPVAGSVMESVKVTLTPDNSRGGLVQTTFDSKWEPAAKETADDDTFIDGATYVLPVEVELNDNTVRGKWFGVKADGKFKVSNNDKSLERAMGPTGYKQTFYLSYTIPIIKRTVVFDFGNGDPSKTVTLNNRDILTEPSDPARDGYEFKGWLLDGKPYDFSDPVTSDMTLVADWEEEKPEPIVPDEPIAPGPDEPTDPDTPAGPDNSDDPAGPTEPDVPAGPTEPVGPEVPEQPGQLEQPGGSDGGEPPAPGQPGDAGEAPAGPGATGDPSDGVDPADPGSSEGTGPEGADGPGDSEGRAPGEDGRESRPLADTSGEEFGTAILAVTGDRTLAVAGALVLAGAASAAVALASRRKAAARGRHAR